MQKVGHTWEGNIVGFFRYSHKSAKSGHFVRVITDNTADSRVIVVKENETGETIENINNS
jgi:hypothetical protein